MVNYEIPELILAQAFNLYQLSRLEKLTNAEERGSKYNFSNTFITKMNKLIYIKKKSYYIFINTMAKRVALVILLILITMFSTVFSVKALRDPTINFIVHIYEKVSTIIFGDENGKNENFPPIIQDYYEPQTIPEGFEIKEKKDMHLLYQVEYSDKNGCDLSFEQFTIKSAHINIDTEGTTCENILINENPGIYFSTKGYQNFIWNDGRYGFNLSGNMPKEKLFEIAKSVQKKK